MARKLPTKRVKDRQPASAFTKANTSKKDVLPLDIQAATRRTNDKPTARPRGGFVEGGGF